MDTYHLQPAELPDAQKKHTFKKPFNLSLKRFNLEEEDVGKIDGYGENGLKIPRTDYAVMFFITDKPT